MRAVAIMAVLLCACAGDPVAPVNAPSAEPAVESTAEPAPEPPVDRAEAVEPEPETGPDRAVGIAAGDGQACAWTREGRVFCWGRDRYGGVGGSTESCQGQPCATAPVEVSVADVVEVAATLDGTCARRRGGEVVCWGLLAGGEGPRDAGFSARTRLDVRMRGVCAYGDDGSERCIGGDLRAVRDVAGGAALPAGTTELRGPGSHACAAYAGELRCWGSCNGGECGPDLDGMIAAPTPTAVARDVARVALGNRFTCVLTRGGDVVCFGDDRFGALGDGPGRSSAPARVRLPLDAPVAPARVAPADATPPILHVCDAARSGLPLGTELALRAYARGGAPVERYLNQVRGDEAILARDARAADPERCARFLRTLEASP